MAGRAEIRGAAICRLIDDPPNDGARQMAVDEALLESAAATGGSTLRFYGWSEPTLSLGYFQDSAERRTHPPSHAAALVRRQTGGGAILHDRELTYSLAVSLEHLLAADSSRLYNAVHRALVETLKTFEIDAHLCACPAQSAGSAQAFLCFLRRTDGDVLVGDAKICGSAQRRRRGAILQHGSLLWARSALAPELPGLEELTGKRPNPGKFVAAWQRQLATWLGFEFEPGGITSAEKQLVDRLIVDKYQTERWNLRR